MEKRIELEKRARKPSQITELNLDNCRSTNIVGLTDEYTALESLSLINVGLTTLKGFPKLPNLKKLELSDNRISNGLNYLTTSPKLQYLNLSGNKIKDLQTLEPLQEFKHLSVLDLFNNEATQIENYREKIFEMLPSLKFLDGFDCNDDEAPSDGEDDEEVNGNDSEDDDKQTSFCLSGLEIDLAELEEFERRIEAKKKMKTKEEKTPSHAGDGADSSVLDDLDLYLAELKLKEAEKSESPNSNQSLKESELKTDNCDTKDVKDVLKANETSPQRPPINFAILLYWFLAILNLTQAAYYYSNDGEGEEEDEDDGEENDEDDASLDEEDYGSNMSLSEASCYYDENDDDDDEEDDDDADSDEEGGGATGAKKPSSGAKDGQKVKENSEAANADAAESQARGKKRKHDG